MTPTAEVATINILEVRNGAGFCERASCIPIEEPLEIRINGSRAAVLMRLPGAEKELAVGFCVSEGLIRGIQYISLVHHCGGGSAGEALPAESRNVVNITVDPEGLSARAHDYLVIRSGCGRAGVEHAAEDFPMCETRATVKAHTIMGMFRAIPRAAGGGRAVGIHTAGLFSLDGSEVISYRDVGRHNAMDKAIGYCLIRDVLLSDKILVTTGRLSYEMVLKAARVNLPIIASLSAPTSLAIDLGRRCNLTVIGYLRNTSFVTYTEPGRIIW